MCLLLWLHLFFPHSEVFFNVQKQTVVNQPKILKEFKSEFQQFLSGIKKSATASHRDQLRNKGELHLCILCLGKVSHPQCKPVNYHSLFYGTHLFHKFRLGLFKPFGSRWQIPSKSLVCFDWSGLIQHHPLFPWSALLVFPPSYIWTVYHYNSYF